VADSDDDLLGVAGSVAGQLQDLGGDVLQNRSQSHRGVLGDAQIGSAKLPNELLSQSHRELESSGLFTADRSGASVGLGLLASLSGGLLFLGRGELVDRLVELGERMVGEFTGKVELHSKSDLGFANSGLSGARAGDRPILSRELRARILMNSSSCSRVFGRDLRIGMDLLEDLVEVGLPRVRGSPLRAARRGFVVVSAFDDML